MKKKGKKQGLCHLFLLLTGVVTVAPFIWMFLGALKTKAEVMDQNCLLPGAPQWGNFLTVLTDSSMLRYLLNSLFVASAVVLIQLVLGILFTYGVTFLKFRGRNGLFLLVLATYLVPSAATYIPGYLILAKLGMLDSYQGLICSNSISIFGIFLLRQAFLQIPYGMVEAARIDGSSHMMVLWRILIPMTRPTIITFVLLSFIGMYNSYMWPSLITERPQLSLISQGLRRYLYEGGAYGTEWALVMAASSLAVIPLLLLFFGTQRFIINGVVDTGIKG